MNPFVQNIKLNVVKVDDSYTLHTNSRGKIRSDAPLKIPNHYYVDKVDNTALFHTPDISDLIFNKLKSAGVYLLMYIQIHLKKNADTIRLVSNDVCEEMHISRGTLHNGLIQLTECGVIVKKNGKDYWINPMYLFNGSRINYFKELGEEYINIVASV